jgi:FkbM family methyltransferase
MKIVQIGSNDGDDSVRQFIIENQSNIDLVVLVEPIPFILDKLKENYKDFNNVFIENIAISDSESKKFTLYYEEGSNYELSSFKKQHLIDCKCIPEKIKSIDVDCLTINQLFEKYSIDTLDYLYIDTEGLDVYIINSIDFNKFKIKNLIFEITHTDGINTDGTPKIGTNYTKITEYLTKLKYNLSQIDGISIKATLHENNL